MSSKVYPISVAECADRLLAAERIAVVTHIRPDGDTVGSCSALCLALAAMGKDAVMIPADKIPPRLEFLTEGVRLSDSAEGRFVVTCDVASPAQLGAMYEELPSIDLSIDHHSVSEPFAPNLTVGDISSAGEVVYRVLSELVSRGALTLTSEIAAPLYAAISSDTGGFMFSSASPETYRAAAVLMECGINYPMINHRLFYSKSEKQIKAEGFVAEKMLSDGNISYAAITLADRARLGLSSEDFETAIDVVRARVDTDVSFVLKELEAGKYRVSLRSTGFNVAEIAREFSGGGHVRAAGCTVLADSPEAAASVIISAIKKRG